MRFEVARAFQPVKNVRSIPPHRLESPCHFGVPALLGHAKEKGRLIEPARLDRKIRAWRVLLQHFGVEGRPVVERVEFHGGT